jgi:xanthine dehydrogenase YagS FAD-binding subunit
MNVALTALEAVVTIQGKAGPREVKIADFFLLPGKTPHLETVVAPGELITHVTLPAARKGSKQVYLKLRDRASYEGGKFAYIRVALGGVGTKPWRSHEAEAALLHHAAEDASFHRAAAVAVRDARPQTENGFKVELTKRCIAHALTLATKSA